nr:HPr kinase/phosphatase C-terminal domain-containing protein [Tabrizicola rongguiensis]
MLLLHASCVAVSGRGMLILGPSGSGKSSLALQMMGLGAELVADDGVEIVLAGNSVVARCPPAIANLIEARQVGLLSVPTLPEVRIVLAVDLGQEEDKRLPERHAIVFHGQRIDLVKASRAPHFPASLLLYLRHGRKA